MNDNTTIEAMCTELKSGTPIVLVAEGVEPILLKYNKSEQTLETYKIETDMSEKLLYSVPCDSDKKLFDLVAITKNVVGMTSIGLLKK